MKNKFLVWEEKCSIERKKNYETKKELEIPDITKDIEERYVKEECKNIGKIKKKGNRCKDCNKIISNRSTYCNRCAQLGRRNPQYGKRYKKYKYCIDCKKEISRVSKRCRHCSKVYQYKMKPETLPLYGIRGNKHPSWKGGLPKCVDCGKTLSIYYVKRCKSCENKRRFKDPKNNPMYGKCPSWKRIKYKDLYVKSTWEAAYAQYLDDNNIEWKYEYKCFDMDNTTYTPDFYISGEDRYVEVKGWWRNGGKEKYEKFCKMYPQIKVEVLRMAELKKIGIKFNRKGSAILHE